MNKKVKDSLSGALWLFAVAIFMLGVLLGFAKFAWIIFLLAAAIQMLIEAKYHSNK